MAGVTFQSFHSCTLPAKSQITSPSESVCVLFCTEIDRGEAAEIAIKSMRQGGQHVLQMMTVGAKWHVAVPPNLAYGPGGDPPRIGPNETLVAEIELLGIKE